MADPCHAEAHRQLGHALDGAGDARGANTAWLMAIALGSDDAPLRTRLEQVGDAGVVEARLLSCGWRLRAGVGVMRRRRWIARLAMARARRAARAGRWAEAALRYDMPALRNDPAAMLQLGHACKEMGDEAAAERAYRRAAALDAGRAEPVIHLAFLLKRTARPALALQMFQVAAALAPGSARAEQGLAELGTRGTQIEDAAWVPWIGGLPPMLVREDGAPPLARRLASEEEALRGMSAEGRRIHTALLEVLLRS